MKRTATLLATLMLVVGAVAAVPLTGAAAQTGAVEGIGATQTFAAAENNTSDSTNNTSIAPGAHLSGAIGTQEAALEGNIESRAFGIQIAKAKTDRAQAQVVAKQLNQTQQRVQELQAELKQLKQARKNGSISNSTYAARAAILHAKIQNVEHMANKTANASQGIPEEVLRAQGINVTAIKTLQENASSLGGQEIAAIARTIAGPSVGNAPATAGPPANQTPGNVTAGPGNQTAGPGNQTGNQTGNQPAGGDRGGQQSGDGSDTTTADGSGAKAGDGSKSGR